MSEERIFEEEELKNGISQAMLWLGYEDVEFNKRFSAKDFEKGKTGEDVLENEIIYSTNSGFVPEPIAKQLAELLEGVLNYHLKTRNIKIKIQEQREKLKQQEEQEKLAQLTAEVESENE